MADSRNFKPAQTKWTVFQLSKFRLPGKPWDKNEPKNRPTLQLTMGNEGNPKFRVYMNDGAMGQTASTAVNFDPVHFLAVFEALLLITESNEPNHFTWGVKAAYENGRKLDTPAVTARVTVGRDSDGVCYLSIYPKNSKNAVFPFLTSYWFELLGSDGEKLNPMIASTIMARSWAKQMSKIANTILANMTQSEITSARNGAAVPLDARNDNYEPRRSQPSTSNWDKPQNAPAANLDFDDDISF